MAADGTPPPLLLVVCATQVPDAEQIWPFPHDPQLRVPTQPLLHIPQFLPSAAHVVGVQLRQLPFMHIVGSGHVPQLNVPAQPSLTSPQLTFSAPHVIAVHWQ